MVAVHRKRYSVCIFTVFVKCEDGIAPPAFSEAALHFRLKEKLVA
jgi:hypothetical protein